jgi:predicted nucleic acid-binding protein
MNAPTDNIAAKSLRGCPEPGDGKRAVEVLRSLAERGQHRAPSIPDLLIAAAAETARLTVVHVDKDFELIRAAPTWRC